MIVDPYPSVVNAAKCYNCLQIKKLLTRECAFERDFRYICSPKLSPYQAQLWLAQQSPGLLKHSIQTLIPVENYLEYVEKKGLYCGNSGEWVGIIYVKDKNCKELIGDGESRMGDASESASLQGMGTPDPSIKRLS